MSPEPTAEQGLQVPVEDPGQTLRNAREQLGLDIGEVSARLKLSRQVILHLESGRYDRLPGDAFTRGYIRSYARLLGLDANRLALQFDRLRGVVSQRPLSGLGGQAEMRARRGARLLRISSWLVVLMLATSALLWWYEKHGSEGVQDSNQQLHSLEDIRIDAMAMPEELHAPVSAELVSALAEIDRIDQQGTAAVPADTAMGESTPAPVEQTAAAAETQTREADQPAPVSAELTAEQPGTEPVDSDRLLLISFRDACWVQVSDSQGQVLHSALMQAGQQLELRHPGPLDLLLGATQAVSSIHYQGQVVEYDSTRSGVTRLRVASRNQ